MGETRTKDADLPPDADNWDELDTKAYRDAMKQSPLKHDSAKVNAACTLIDASRQCRELAEKIGHTAEEHRAWNAAQKTRLKALESLQLTDDIDDEEEGGL